MRIHEILEACIEYIAFEGVLGCQPSSLVHHLSTIDSSIDTEYFTHFWTLLIKHPSVHVITTTYPVPSENGTRELGNAPLPDDYVPPPSDAGPSAIEVYEEQGIKGRALASFIAGEEFKTSRQVIEEKRSEKQRKKLAGRGKPKIDTPLEGEEEEVAQDGGVEYVEGEDTDLYQYLRADGAETTIRGLADLTAHWGSRLRVRCSDDEIWMRLTGSAHRISKITPIVFHILQLSAKSREKGVTALEIGPAINASQGSVFHYMKALTTLGLCAKVPYVVHAALTNLLVHHKFLTRNEEYQILQRRIASTNGVAAGSSTEVAAELNDGADDESGPIVEEDGAGEDEGPKRPGLADLDFSELSDQMALNVGILRERLLVLLDHPGLENHLLRTNNILYILGLRSQPSLRQKRVLRRAIDGLIMDNLVENIEIHGMTRVRCIRLTKYNPDFDATQLATASDPSAAVDRAANQDVRVVNPAAYLSPYTKPLSGLAINVQVLHSFLDTIRQSGQQGIIVTDLHHSLGNLWHRAIEFAFVRMEKNVIPANLAHLNVCAVMETLGRERRLRNYTVESFRQMMANSGQPVDQRQYPPLPAQAGHWADLSFRHFYQNMDEYVNYIWQDYTFDLEQAAIEDLPKQTRKRAASGEAQENRPSTGKRVRGPNQPKLPSFKSNKALSGRRQAPLPRLSRMPGPQIRGRPRKYIHVVSEAGSVLRHIIGQIAPRPELPHILVYVKDLDILVAGPDGYSGVGAPPRLTDTDMKKSWRPEFFRQFPSNGKSATKTPRSKRETASESDASEGIAEPGPSKRKTKAPTFATFPESDTSPRRSKRARKETDYSENQLGEDPASPPQEEDDELESDTDEKQEAGPPSTAALQALGVGSKDAKMDSNPSPAYAQRDLDAILAVMQQELQQDSAAAAVVAPQSAERDETPQATTTNESAAPAEVSTLAVEEETEAPFEEMVDASHAPPELSEVVTSDNVEPLPLDTKSTLPRPHAPVVNVSEIIPPLSGEEQTEQVPQLVPPTTAQAETFNTLSVTGTMDSVAQAATPVPVTPTRDATHASTTSTPSSRAFNPVTTHKGRLEFGAIRRVNEIIQALTEAGGVSTEMRLRDLHTEWTKTAAGTDTPHAPPTAYLMDRNTYRRSLTACLDDGRLRQTKSSAPSTHGKWVQHTVIYLTDLPQETLNTFLQELTIQTVKAMTPLKKLPSTIMSSSPFTEVVIPSGQGAASTKSTPSRPSLLQASASLTPREALLRDHQVVSYLYGYLSGRYVRLKRLHTAICRAMRSPAPSSNIASRAPRVFAFPLCFEDITISDFLAIITYTKDYDEDLERFVTDPATKDTLLRDVPRTIWPEKSFGKAHVSHRFRRLLQMMQELKLLTPVAKTDAGEGSFKVKDGSCFTPIEDISTASWFIMHDLAPVYQLSSTPAPLLGLLPTSSDEELQTLWNAIERVAIGPDVQSLVIPRQHMFTGPPQTAQLEGVLSISPDSLRSLRSRIRWQHEIKLDVLQRSALDGAIDWKTGEQLVTEESDLATLAYNYALSLPFVKRYIPERLEVAKSRLQSRAKADAFAKQSAEDRARKSEAALRRILTERRKNEAEAFKARVVAAADRSGMPYEDDMIRYVHFQRNFFTRRVELTDSMLDQFIYLFKRSKEVGVGPQPERAEKGLRKAPMSRRAKREEKEVGKQRQNRRVLEKGRQGRKRLAWSAAEDELMLECEVVLRVRGGCRPGQSTKDRAALEKLLPHRSEHAIKDRIRKRVTGHEGLWPFLHELEQAWRPIWLRLRGTDELPDPNPEDNSDFNLRRHVEVFHEKVPLAPWRQSAIAASRGLGTTPELPGVLSDVFKRYRIDVDPRANQGNWSWEKMMWDEITPEVGRWQALSSTSMLMPDVANAPPTRVSKLALAEAALRMVYNTPTEVYDTATADALTDNFDAELISHARSSLTQSKVLLGRKGFLINPRELTFSSAWLAETEGPLRPELEEEFVSFDQKVHKHAESDDWPQPVSLVADGGAVAELMELVSSSRISFDFDPKEFPTVKWCNDAYNTKRFNDDSFEYKLRYRAKDLADLTTPITQPPSSATRRNILWQGHEALLHPTDEVIECVRSAIDAAGVEGVTRPGLAKSLKLSRVDVDSALAILSAAEPVQMFWSGYDTARAVSSKYKNDYSVSQRPAEDTGELNEQSVPPRRWFDIHGAAIEGDWEKCLRCVKGHVFSRPGITEEKLRAKIDFVLDRVEQNEVMQQLLDKGVLRRAKSYYDEADLDYMPPAEATDDTEGRDITWWPAENGDFWR